jgi:hypothetical protein
MFSDQFERLADDLARTGRRRSAHLRTPTPAAG